MSAQKSVIKKKVAKKKVKKSLQNLKKAAAPKKKKSFKVPVKITKGLTKPSTVKAVSKKPLVTVVKAVKEKKVITNSEYKESIEKAHVIKRVRKSSKKQVIALPPPPNIELSNFPKIKVRQILVSQPKPVETEKNPYHDLAKKYHIDLTFRQFIRVEGLNAQEFRAQRIDILEHGAVILTSKLAVDHYFRICQEMRITVPESMKYFCINEQTAYYLQKYIQYRKRKIFFGHGTIIDLVDVIRKNKAEKFLLPSSDAHKEQIVDFLDEVKITFTKAIFYKTVSADLKDIKSLADFDMLVFFTPAGIKSLKHNFPNLKQGNIRIAAFGHATALMVKTLGYRLDVFAPNPKNPSMTGALDSYLKEASKK
ncbi:uroporphyrinogen-III synthase [Aurantibacillus circumpalustris]|uniref:uroporphyrinogen-III synthase n=1 Tax=Aurantibacillus circumpalustris TaxID=3036359 RepID=UPI00295A884A|nr:uroporphyrinogen-III synthase [Aurantibacillus circumpalustris]